jgi:hypothetical protein
MKYFTLLYCTVLYCTLRCTTIGRLKIIVHKQCHLSSTLSIVCKLVLVTNTANHIDDITNTANHIDDVMISVLASSAVDRGFELRSGRTKDYKIGICCSSAKHASLRRKSKDRLTRNQNNVSEWRDMSVYPRTVVSVR